MNNQWVEFLPTYTCKHVYGTVNYIKVFYWQSITYTIYKDDWLSTQTYSTSW